MALGTGLIFFDNPEDWQAVVNITREAQVLSNGYFAPIPSFDLGVNLNSSYISVLVSTTRQKPSWFSAGDIAQVYNFAPGGSDIILSKIYPKSTRLYLDRLQLVKTNKISTDSFRLRYNPPNYFEDCTIKVYKYIGDELNFIEDTLFDIGNALGVDANQNESLIGSQLQVIEELITDKFLELRNSRESELALDNLRENSLLEKINQLETNLYTVTEILQESVSLEKLEEIKQRNKTDTNMDFGF